jgi:hypothetical protein
MYRSRIARATSSKSGAETTHAPCTSCLPLIVCDLFTPASLQSDHSKYQAVQLHTSSTLQNQATRLVRLSMACNGRVGVCRQARESPQESRASLRSRTCEEATTCDFLVKLFSTRESLHYNDVATIGNHTQARVERTVLNHLEALREPVYDLIHAGGTISLFLTTSRSRRSVDLMKLFHLGSEEWLAVR